MSKPHLNAFLPLAALAVAVLAQQAQASDYWRDSNITGTVNNPSASHTILSPVPGSTGLIAAGNGVLLLTGTVPATPKAFLRANASETP